MYLYFDTISERKFYSSLNPDEIADMIDNYHMLGTVRGDIKDQVFTIPVNDENETKYYLTILEVGKYE